MQQCFGITSACEPGPLTWRARCERRFSVARLSLCLSHPPPPRPAPPPLTHTKATCASPPKPTHSPKQGSLSIPLVHTNNTESCTHTHMHTELHVSCVARKSFPYHLLSFSHKCDLTRRLSRPQEQTCWASLVTDFMVFFISPITSPHFHSLPILKEKKGQMSSTSYQVSSKNKI